METVITQKQIKDWSCPEPNSGCWLWMRGVNSSGYDQIWIGDRTEQSRGRTEQAHRRSWTAFIGPIPDGLCVLHRCDTRCCVRTDHLFLGTYEDNNKDTVAKNRSDNRAEKNGRAKLTWQDVNGIRIAAVLGGSVSFLA